MVTAAGERASRRLGRRRHESGTTPDTGTTPEAVGAVLRAAREEAGVTLAEVHDRTGVPSNQLEALEAGEFAHLPDRRSALVAVHRYADLLELDAADLARGVEEHWSPVVGTAGPAAGAPTGAVQRGTSGTSGPSARASHLSRYPGDGSHLRAFTQTAQVPSVGGGTPNGRGHDLAFARTGMFAAIPRRHVYVRPAPLPLRVAVGITAALVAIGLLGLAVNHWNRQWLADLHIIRSTTNGSASTGAQSLGALSSQPSTPSSGASTVSQADSSPASSTVTVRSANFHVVVAAIQPCWIYVSTPQGTTPIFTGTLQAGQTSTFDSSGGQLGIQLGASQVVVAVKIGNKLVPGWLFRPAAAPYTVNFTSAPNS